MMFWIYLLISMAWGGLLGYWIQPRLTAWLRSRKPVEPPDPSLRYRLKIFTKEGALEDTSNSGAETRSMFIAHKDNPAVMKIELYDKDVLRSVWEAEE